MKRFLSALALVGMALTPALSAATPDRVFDIASMLSGTFEGSTPGNHLRLDLKSLTIDPGHPYDLFLSVNGQFEKNNIQQQGVMRLEQQGRDITLTYIPHFNPATTALAAGAGKFTEHELSSACSFTLKPKGDGFIGDTLGSTSCAFAMRGAVGKWAVEIEPGNLRVRNVDSGETLRFKQTGKLEAAK